MKYFTTRILPLLCVFLLLPLSFSFRSATHSLLNGPTITLEGNQGRFWVHPEGVQTLVNLCGLAVGEEYRVQLSDSFGDADCQPRVEANPLFVGDSHETAAFDRGIVVKAKADCLQLRLIMQNADCDFAHTDVMLSVVSLGEVSPQVSPPGLLNPPAISTTPGIPVSTLITDFLIGGDCYEIAGITDEGSANQKGTFINGATSIGIPDGIILSTGNTTIATGPNNQTGASTDEPNTATDPDLADIIGGAFNLNDVAKIEFDFTPTVDTIRFNYVFASEEYCDFTNTGFNDVFGFFISGPGINGPYTNNAENIAVIPGTATPVAINNVNHLNNPTFYVGNIPAGSGQLNNPNCAGHPISGPPATSDCQFDGYTTILTAEAVVIPCSTYHIKLAIADVLDGIYDSAVFFESNSLDLGGPAQVEAFGSIDGTNIVYEGCTGAYFEFTRDDPTDTSLPQTITFNISVQSTADNGVDYVTIPLSVTIPAGQVSVQLPIDAFDDQIPEGQETIILELDSPCTCSTNEITMIIDDPPMLNTPLQDQDICEGNGPVTLDATANGGIPPFTYTWSTGSTNPSISVDPLMDETYFVTITDDCGNMTVDTATVTVSAAPTAVISGSGTFCENGGPNTLDLTINFTGSGPWQVVYSVDGISQPPITTSDNPYTLTVDASGIYELESVSTGGGGAGLCPGTVSGLVQITETTISPTVDGLDPLCNGDTNGSVFASGSGGTPAYTYQWNNGSSGQTVTGVPAGTYTVTITDANGCTETGTYTITDPPALDVTVTTVQNVDCNNATGSITVSGSGGTPGYNYGWSNGASGPTAGNLPPGSYDVTIVDANGCTDIVSAEVVADLTPPQAAANTPGLITCAEPSLILDGNGSSTGSGFTYNWTTNNGNIVSGGNTLNPTIDQPGTYTLTVTNTGNGCTQTASVTVGEDTTPPTAVAFSPPITCDNPSVIIDGSNSSSGPDFSYNWTTNNGNILNGGNTATPEVNAPGIYTLTVTDETNGCETNFAVNVPDDTNPPTANATAGQLTCVISELFLDGSGSSLGPDFTYLWTTNDGNIVSGETTLNPLVDQSGTYTLEVEDDSNGCTQQVSVFVGEDTTPPTADAGTPEELNCLNTVVTLDGSGSQSGPGIIYSWTTNDGQIVGGANTTAPIVNAPGTYTILVFNTANGCEATDDVVVTEDVELPVVTIAQPAPLTCDEPLIELDATGSASQGDLDYIWVTSNGNIVDGQGTLTPTVDAGGIYTLNIINNDNFCSNGGSVTVTDLTDYPTIAVTAPQTLTCGITEVVINATGSENQPNFQIDWTTADGNITSGGNTLTPTVDLSGTYTLTIFDPSNNCLAEQDVFVPADLALPTVDAGPPDILNCAETNLLLNGSASGSPNLSYQWSSPDGNILQGDNTPNPLVDAPGTYILEVVNENNDCENTDEVVITEDVTIPTVDAGPASEINCYEPTYTLDGSGSDTGPEFQYLWTTPDGNIISGDDGPSPTVDAGGSYWLTVLNTDNQCLDSAEVDIAEDLLPPLAEAGPQAIINCYDLELNLDGTDSDQGPDYQYQWTTPDGNILADDNTTEPLIDAPGTYELTVTNTDNGCESVDQVLVDINLVDPVVDAGTGGELTCTQNTVQLQGAAQGNTVDFTYNWTTPDGNILNGDDGLDPVVDAPGNYIFTVTDTENGCNALDTVVVTQDADIPSALINPDTALNCVNQLVTLDGSNSTQGPSITFEWEVANGGNIISGDTTLTPQIDAPGQYTLIITDAANDCVDQAVVNIVPDTLNPVISFVQPPILTCDLTSLDLEAQVNAASSDLDLVWTTPDGNLVDGTDGLQPEVDAPGTYFLEVIDSNNGCTGQAQVEVLEDVESPTVSVSPPPVLDCALTELNLAGAYNSGGDPVVIDWTTSDGNILSGTDSTDPLVDAPGTYTMSITNETNGCFSEVSIPVDQDITPPMVEAGSTDILNCDITQLSLQGTGSTGTQFTYQWTTNDGNILSGNNGLEPEVDAPGTYVLTIVNSDNNCVSVDSTQIAQDIQLPTVDAGPATELTCTLTDYVLQGSGSTGSDFEYMWTTADGNILSNANTATPLIDAPGTYVLEVHNTENGCESFDTVAISEDVVLPQVAAAVPGILTCTVTSLSLDGIGSSVGVDYTYEWTTPDGNILNGADGLQPEVDAPGTYILEVLDTDNGCVSTESVSVDQDIQLPTADAGSDGLLTCTVTELNLEGDGSSQGAIYTYEWTTPDGNIITGATAINPLIDAPGLYELTVTNTENGCVSDAVVNVEEDVVAPDILILAPAELNCSLTELALDASGSDPGNYQWTSSDGNILNGDDSPAPVVDQPGTYELTVTNPLNGCVNQESVDVSQNIVDPLADAGPDGEITCLVTSLSLEGTASGDAPVVNIQWTTSDGNIVSGQNSEDPVIDAPGTYQLTVTDPENGCVTTDEVSVAENNLPPQVAVADPEILTCTVTAVPLNGADSETGPEIIYSWTTPDGNILGDPTQAVVDTDSPGTYTLEVINSYTGCVDEITVSVDQDIEAPVVNAGDEWILPCYDETVILNGSADGSGTLTYTWTTPNGQITGGAQSLSPTVGAPGQYELLVTNQTNGCTATDQTQVIEVRPEEAIWDPASPLCVGDFGLLVAVEVVGGTPPYIYSIDGGETFTTDNVFQPLDPDFYDVVVQDALGCEIAGTEIIQQPQEVLVDLESRVELQFGDTYQLEALTNLTPSQIGSVSWTPATGLSCTDCLDPLANPLETTEYEVVVTDINGCQAESRVLLVVDKRPAVYVPNIFSPDNDGDNDIFMLFAKPGTVREVQTFLVFSRWGETVFEYSNFQPNDPAFGWDGNHRGEPLDPAVFAWYAIIEMIDGRIELLEGDVTLVR